jgi:hypothetical protein
VTAKDLKEQIVEAIETASFADGFDEALIGYVERFGNKGPYSVALYDRAKCIKVLMDRDGMSEEEAVEFFNFNTAGAYAGPHTPAFATILTEGP